MNQAALMQHELTKRFHQKSMTKKDLYDCIWCMRANLNIPFERSCYRIGELTCDYVQVESRRFENKNLCGIINKAMAPGISHIVINSNNSREIQRFSLLHELMHWFFHSPNLNHCNIIGRKELIFEDYQANEGAAEFLMPCMVVVMTCAHLVNKNDLSLYDIEFVKGNIAKYFGVTDGMVYNRIESLKYEIWQYANGVDFGSLKMLSKKQQLAKGIKIGSLNDTEWLLRHGYSHMINHNPLKKCA